MPLIKRDAVCPLGPDCVILISGTDFSTSIKSIAPLSFICFLVITILLVPFFEKIDVLEMFPLISKQGLLNLLSHLQSCSANISLLMELLKFNK